MNETHQAREIQVTIHGAYGHGPMPVEFRDALVEMVRLVKQAIDDGTLPERRRTPGHTFIPLSGSQGPDGRYQRCGVDGCLVAPEHHRRASSTAAEGE